MNTKEPDVVVLQGAPTRWCPEPLKWTSLADTVDHAGQRGPLVRHVCTNFTKPAAVHASGDFWILTAGSPHADYSELHLGREPYDYALHVNLNEGGSRTPPGHANNGGSAPYGPALNTGPGRG